MALLARWFRFQPSEIEALTVADFLTWCELAAEQIGRETGPGGA
jgi:predicted nicotinamide N-methyase